MNWDTGILITKFRYTLAIVDFSYDKAKEWISEFFNSQSLEVKLEHANSRITARLQEKITDRKLSVPDAVKISSEFLPETVLVYFNPNISEFISRSKNPYPFLNGVTSSGKEFVGISQCCKKIVFHEFYHVIGLDEHKNSDCIMNPVQVGKKLCTDCKKELELYLQKWYENKD